MSAAEKKEFFAHFRITEKNLPHILATDSAIKHMGSKEGDIVKIIRNSPVSGQAIYYRVVVE